MPSKHVILAADIHLGVPNRTDDIIWALRVLREYARENDITEIIILGDLYHDRTAINIGVINTSLDFFQHTKNDYGQNWIIFPGNHDMYLKHSWGSNSLRVVRDYTTIIDDIKLLTLDERRLWIVPFIDRESVYMDVIKKVEEKHEPDDILLTHIGVKSATLNTCFLLKHWSFVDFTDSKFRTVYTGHFHSAQQVGTNLWYPGSIIPFKMDEGDVSHGFLDLNLGTGNHRFIDIWKAGVQFFPDEVPPPQYNSFIDTMLEDKAPDDIANRVIRVVATREHSQDTKSEIVRRLMDAGARSVTFARYAPKDERMAELTKAQSQLLAADVLFDRLLESDVNGTKGLSKNLLRKINQQVIAKGDEIYLQRAVDE